MYRPFVLDVLHVDGEALVELVSFHTDSFAAFGLPAAIPAEEPAPDENDRRNPFLL